jgi:acyl homoserine lactone synthase
MLPELFPDLLNGADAPRDPVVWELSRFATDVRKTGQGRMVGFSEVTVDLLEAIFEFARGHGIERLLLVTSIGIERLLMHSGLHVHRLGIPARLGGSLSVAVFIEVPSNSFKILNARATMKAS